MAVKIKGWHIAALVLLILAYMWYTGSLQIQVQRPVPQQPTAELVSVNKPLKFSLTDPLAGAAIGSANIYIYGPDKVLRETLTTASDGTVVSALPYASDTTIYVKVVKSGYVTRWFTITVPKMTPADAESLTSNYIALQTVNLGTYTIKAVDQFGNTYASGGSLNFTALGASTVSVTFTIYNTEDNSGYVSSYDFINGINLNAVFQTSTGGSSVVVNGAGNSVQRGTTTYWLTVLSDDGLTRQIIGQTYVKPGQTSVVITFNKGALSAGQSQAFTFNLMAYFDPAYFASQGIGGPEAVTLASFSLTLRA